MRFVIDRCDVCKADYDVQYPKPIGWITWKIADLDEEDIHFCSENCLRQYLQVPAQQEPLDKPACKARRFLLVDESANIQEGVKWGNGKVTIEADTEIWTHQSWDKLKEHNPGSGVQWIDQEVIE